jgi:hypothetical protein
MQEGRSLGTNALGAPARNDLPDNEGLCERSLEEVVRREIVENRRFD